MKRHIVQFVLVFTLAASAARPQAFGFADPSGGGSGPTTQSEIEYQKAMRLLDQSRWDAALKQFQEIGAHYKDKADAALYWQAYAQSKLGQASAALQTLARFKASYPASRWLNDAQALQLELRQSSGQHVAPESVGGDEDLKLMALNGLMSSDPERALPILEKTLQGNASVKVKERALFVLSQNDSPAGRAIVERIARGSSNPDLQKKALRNIALFGSPQSRQTLSSIYASSSDVEVKREILRGFMISGDKERLAMAAKGEKNPELRKEAIRQLGVMGDHKTLSELYASESDRQVKEQILQGLFVGGAVDKLIELSRTERDPELQKKAINNLGLTGQGKAGDALVAMYHSSSDRGVKGAVLNALSLQNNGKALVDIARKESNPELKREAVQKLSLTHTKEGSDFFTELLNK
jgi:tetratricopeptide (TPR) repeat protein